MSVQFSDVVRVSQPTIRERLLSLGWTPGGAAFIADALPDNPRFARKLVRKILGRSAVTARFPKDTIPEALRAAVFERDGHACKKCQSKERLEADHITPESKGGATTLDNLQTLCHDCNMSKGASA